MSSFYGSFFTLITWKWYCCTYNSIQ